MAITRIKSNQITDAAVTTAKIADGNITADKLATNLTYGSDFTVSGNLTVSGTTTSVSTTNTRVEDAVIALSAEASGSGSVDSGLLINRGSDDNQFIGWDESTDTFVVANVGAEDGDTAGNINLSSFAGFKAGAITGAAITGTGQLNIDATTASTSVTSGAAVIDGGIGIAGAAFIGGTLDVASGQTVDFNTNALTNVADPSNAQDAATKAYVDSEVSSGSTLTIAADSGSNDTVTVGTNTLTFAGTANEVNTTVSDNQIQIGLPDNVTVGGALTVTGNLTVNGTTTTISTTNSVVEDNLIELNNGAGSNANDAGIVIERGSTGDNAIIAWDESADGFIVGTTTATGTSTGDLTITAGAFQAGAATLASAAIGGGYGSTGATISAAGVGQFNGALTADGLLNADGGIDIGSSVFAVSTAGIVTTVEDIRITADNKQLEIGAGTDFTIGHDGTDTTITNATGILKVEGVAGSSIRINEAGANVDTIIEGDSNASLVVVDASQDNIGFGGAPNANAIVDFNATNAILLARGTTAQRPTGVTGQFRYNTTTNGIEYYDNAGWKSISTDFTLATSQTFNGDGSETGFTLASLTGSDSYTVAGVFVTLNGVVQQPTVVYGISGTTLTFTTAPASGDLIEVRKFTTTTTVVGISDTDGDTQIQVEESSDEDTIRFDAAANEIASIAAHGQTINNELALRFAEASGNGSNYIGLKSPAAVSSNVTFTLPGADGTAGQAIVTDASGNLSFAAAGATISADTSTDTDFLLYFASTTSGALTAVKQDSGLIYNPSSGLLTSSAFAGNLTGNVTGDTSGSSGTCTGLAGSATVLATARNIGGVSFDGSAAINLPGVNTSGNQDTSGTAAIATTVTVADESSDTACNVLFATAATGNLGPKSGTNLTFDSANGNLTTTTFTGTATNAQYADLAEMYATDGDIEAGTVVHFGGEGKVAQCDTANCRTVAGIISTDPAHLMNANQEGAALAIAGRVPCKVTGAVAAGDLMVSAGNGMAMANNDASMGTVIGKAIEAHEGGEGVIEVLAMMM